MNGTCVTCRLLRFPEAEDLPQEVFAFTAALVLRRQKRCTVHTQRENWPLKCDTHCESAYIPREEGRSTYDVVPFMEVYNKSLCRPREVLVEIQQEYPDDTEHIFIPSCVVLTRCAGCCNDEMMECTPIVTYNITLEIKRVKPLRNQVDFFMSFAEHSECQCRVRKDIPEKREKKPRKGKGQKRKRKKNREKKRDFSQCEPCCSTCSERKRRLFVQDPETCQCSCKHSEADCRSRQLELNERTCRCDKPRR
ncbi:vascular endothelial growth factor Ab isoform X2 [Onychostoma macrolepis]|uniref:vascular endothelial growth factor Ab isoform X2 n=1 Tax=Onychostoma macrolepis TaxID=369639 RepID=UPI00272A544B|nr:vascular endothelial growth factor Ab isoform X2 [Onychostoma macrolepis]